MLKFTEKEIKKLTSNGCILDENNNTLYDVVKTEVVDIDREKNSNDVEYIILEIASGKYYRGILLDSNWIGQNKYNASVRWEEVIRKEIKTYKYVKAK
jgi:hypothetical protein